MYRNHFFMSLLLRAKTQPERTHYSTQKQTLNSFSSTASFSIATQTSSYKGYSMKAFFFKGILTSYNVNRFTVRGLLYATVTLSRL